jgi:hypothetical protein
MEYIVGVAIYLNEEVHALPKPLRHHNIIGFLAARGFDTPIGGIQGFITDKNRFIGREEARTLAIANGQAADPIHSRELFSEDLW